MHVSARLEGRPGLSKWHGKEPPPCGVPRFHCSLTVRESLPERNSQLGSACRQGQKGRQKDTLVRCVSAALLTGSPRLKVDYRVRRDRLGRRCIEICRGGLGASLTC